MSEKIIKGGLSAILTAFTIYANNLAVPFIVLFACVVVDVTTGITSAFINHEWNSKVCKSGIFKKTGYLAIVAVAMVLDFLISYSGAAIGFSIPTVLCFALLVTIWLIINECISVLENVDKMGVHIPKWMKPILKRLSSSVDDSVVIEGESEECSNLH